MNYIPDLLKEPIKVDGIELDATVSAQFERYEGKTTVDLEYERVYVLINDERFEISKEQFANNHAKLKEHFEVKLQALAYEALYDCNATDLF